jgi:hypothetical protein
MTDNKGMPISRTCLNCGADFTVPPIQIRRGGGKYCSYRCRSQHTRTPLRERFLARVEKTETCWLWTARTGTFGYGVMPEGGHAGRDLYAHRISYELFHGPIPEGLFVLHRCDNPRCVNPDHLFLGTADDNAKDAARKKRVPSGAQHHTQRPDHKQVKLDQQSVREIRQRYAEGATRPQLSKLYGVTVASIGNVVNGRTWRNVD